MAHIINRDMPSAKELAESAFGKGSISSNVTAILGFNHFEHGDVAAVKQMLLASLGKDPAVYLTRFSLPKLHLETNCCEKSEPHVNWLVELETEGEQKVALGNALEECYERRQQAEVV